MNAGRRGLQLRAAAPVVTASVLLLLGCASLRTGVTIATQRGVVRGQSRADVRLVSSLLDDTVRSIEALLPDAHCSPVSVMIDSESVPEGSDHGSFTVGRADGHEILLSPRGTQLPVALTHELTHVALGPLWERLPAAAQEGLCDVVAERLVGAVALQASADRLVLLSRLTGPVTIRIDWLDPADSEAIAAGLNVGRMTSFTVPAEVPENGVDLAQLLAASDEDLSWLGPQVGYAYAAGYGVIRDLVDCVGFEGLANHCRELSPATSDVRVSTAALLASAGWSGRSMQDCVAGAWTPTLLRQALKDPFIAETIVRSVDSAFAGPGRSVVDDEVTVSVVLSADSEGRRHRTPGVTLNLADLAAGTAR